MGVKDLMMWIKKTHAEAVVSIPQRWAAVEVRGSRVAIDGTLITNRFHFAVRDRIDMRGKHTLRGWYALITEMKRNDVQPVVIWDERGDRPWKAPEARRRIEARALSLARKLHEDRRAVRLGRLKRELERFGLLSEAEQAVVRMWWQQCGTQNTDTSAKADPTPGQVHSDLYFTSDPQFLLSAYVISRIAGHLKRLSWIVDGYWADMNPELWCGPLPMTLFEAFEAEEEELCRIAGGDEDAATLSAEEARLWAEDSDEVATALEARLVALEPASVYRETPRQKALTESEGEVYNLAFGTTVHSTPTESDPIPTCESENFTLLFSAALAQVDELRVMATKVRDTYVSNLFIPLESEHAACRELLELMGIPVLIAQVPYEAEGFASALALRGVVDFVGTEDSDVIVYGAPLLRNLSASGPLVHVDSARLRSLSGMSETQFRDFCILLGTDASPRIPGIGPSTAQSLIEKYGTIEAILSGDPDVRPRLAKLYKLDPDEVTDEHVASFMRMVESSRELFAILPPTPDAIQSAEYSEARDCQVRAWLWEKHDILVRVGEAVEPEPKVDHEAEEYRGLDYTEQADEMYSREQASKDGDFWDEMWDGDAQFQKGPTLRPWEG